MKISVFIYKIFSTIGTHGCMGLSSKEGGQTNLGNFYLPFEMEKVLTEINVESVSRMRIIT